MKLCKSDIIVKLFSNDRSTKKIIFNYLNKLGRTYYMERDVYSAVKRIRIDITILLYTKILKLVIIYYIHITIADYNMLLSYV